MFKVIQNDDSARRGTLETAHGEIQTPVFMNVATQAVIKGGLSAVDLKDVGCQVMLNNTYHLHLRPGQETVRQLGGLHRFTGWDGPILTDSGGFQVFSLAKLRDISEEGVKFASHIDGRRVVISPEDSIRIQAALGSDIVMAFDECIENPSPHEYVAASCERTTRWLARCATTWREERERSDAVNPGQLLFGINQGGVYSDLRLRHLEQIVQMDLPGYAIGGLAVGEETEEMYRILDVVCPWMPQDKPRYLMGVGTPANILEAVARGVDFFDCVMPSRNARHGHVFSWNGVLNLKNEKYRLDDRPIDEHCGCIACQQSSRAYLRHLLVAREVLYLRFAVAHNLYFYNQLMVKIRESIANGTFSELRRRGPRLVARCE